MHDLFFGTGVTHTILLLSFVIGMGLLLSKLKVRGITLGSTWILFTGIVVSHFGLLGDPVVLQFVKDFGLVLFVFSIGLQVGPGFFHTFKHGGVRLNLLSVLDIAFAFALTWILAAATGVDLPTMVGVMSGAVTNTPGLGAAQQTASDVLMATGATSADAAALTARMSGAYAVAYPMGVLGVIIVLIILRALFRVDLPKEAKELDGDDDPLSRARRMHVRVGNPAIFGKRISEVLHDFSGDPFVVSRIMKGEEISAPEADTVLEEGDKLLLVTTQGEVDRLRELFGEEVPMHLADWQVMDHRLVVKRITVTKSSLTGKKLSELKLRSVYGVSVTRIVRAGVELVARPNLYVQMGDGLMCVGTEESIEKAAELVGNTNFALNRPNLIPIFLGIVFGVIAGSIPIRFPGIPQAVRLGIAGGPLVVAILLGYFGPRYKITTYTTVSANLMIREIGLSLFLAAVGLGAGEHFVDSLRAGGYLWILYGFLITVVPNLLTGMVARWGCRLNFYQICGLLIGSTTNAPVLGFARDAYGTDYASVNYATVYPLSMFLRVLVAQLLILLAFA